MSRIWPRILLFLAVLGAVPASTRADDAVTAVNPATGQTESVWSAVPPGGSARIHFAVLQGTQWSNSEPVSSGPDSDRDPDLFLTGAGSRHVVWWRDGANDAVYYSEKSAGTGSWTPATRVSSPSVEARSPSVAVFGGTVYVGFETLPSTGPRVVYISWLGAESPDPWPGRTIATASQSGPLNVQVNVQSGHLWVDWVDSAGELGWSESLSGTWSTPRYTAYSGSGDIEGARGRIRLEVLGD